MVHGICKAGARMPRAAPVWVLGLLLAGCSSTVSIQPNTPSPVVEPVPVSVGVYYADALRNHTCTGGKGYIAFEWTVGMGPPSIAMFDRLFAAMFREAETVDTSPGATPAPGLRDVIEVRLTEFNGCDARWPIIGITTVRVAYEAILWSAQGRELTRWQGRGQAGPRDPLDGYRPSGEAAYLAALTSLAMRKAATDFVLNFEGNSKVQARLKK